MAMLSLMYPNVIFIFAHEPLFPRVAPLTSFEHVPGCGVLQLHLQGFICGDPAQKIMINHDKSQGARFQLHTNTKN